MLIAEHDPIAAVILWITVIFSMAILGRYLAKCCHQPAVLGELLMGMVFGNLCYFFGLQLMVILREGSAIYAITAELLHGQSLTDAIRQTITNPHYSQQLTTALTAPQGMDYVKIAFVLDMFARFGVIFLLFLVGLESSLTELQKTGRQAIQVAVIGVIAPIILGFIVAYLLMPQASYKADLFVAATLCATSIGITARVLTEMGRLHSREAKTILGAAMLDDVLGLIILAIVSSIVINGQVDVFNIIHVIMATCLFFGLIVAIGPWLVKQAISYSQFLTAKEQTLFISLIFVMLLAWLATVIHLAAIIGAFAAGLILHDNFFTAGDNQPQRYTIHDLVSPLESLLAPLFFMLMGMQVKLETFFDWQVIIIASGLIVAAIVGKLISGVGGSRADDRLAIGIGMLPRGEVGLVFAAIGRTLGVMSDQLFSAIVLMIVVTTIMTPPLLKRRYVK